MHRYFIEILTAVIYTFNNNIENCENSDTDKKGDFYGRKIGNKY